MRVTAYKTEKIVDASQSLFEVVCAALPQLPEKSVVAVSSKIAGICEGRLVPIGSVDKDELIARESERYLPRSLSRYNASFAITHHVLVPSAGIDESNGNGNYVLWPADPQATANQLRRDLCRHFKREDLGLILTDSTVQPMRWGVIGIAIASSGFEAVEDDIGTADIFGRPLQKTKTSIQDGLAAAAALVMGETNQQTPLAVLEELPFVRFTHRDPTPEELAAMRIEPEDDLYGPFLASVAWHKGSAPKSS